MVNRIYPAELQLNKANSSDIEAPFWGLNLSISNGTVSIKMYDKWDDFDFDIVNFPFFDRDVPRRTPYGVYISHLVRFARASSNLSEYSCQNRLKLPSSLSRAIVMISYVRLFLSLSPTQ